MSRFGAFAIHLGISLLIFAALAYLVVAAWYPDFFFASDGGWQGIRIIAFVDLILGPSLTLIVFRKGKPGLSGDLTMIGIFQLACLAGGTYIVYSERPIAIVYSDGYFISMSQESYLGVGATVPDLSDYPGTVPRWVMVTLPDDPHEQGKIRMAAWQAGRSLRTVAEHYAPFSIDQVDLVNDAYPIEYLKDRDRDSDAIADWLATYGGNLEDYAFFPMGTRFKYLFLGVDRSTQRILGVIDIPAPVAPEGAPATS